MEGMRKVFFGGACILFSVALPVVYNKLGISENVTLVCLGVIGSVTTFYFGANVLAKKYGE